MVDLPDHLSPAALAQQIADQTAGQDPLPSPLTNLPTPLSPELLAQVAQALKKIALSELRRDAQRAALITDRLTALGTAAGSPLIEALATQTHAIIQTLAHRDYAAALSLFEQASAVFEREQDELELAVTQVTRIWALACVQRYDEAFAAGKQAQDVLQRHEAQRTLAALKNNLVAIHGRRGDDTQALAHLQDVLQAYESLGEEGTRRLPLALVNQAILLRTLGRFEESLTANVKALSLAETLGQTANVARAKQNLGITYFTLGRMSQAQALLEEARTLYIQDGRFRDAILTDLFITDGLLHLRRFAEVIEKCRQARTAFAEAGTRFEMAQAWLNEATALSGLKQYDEALTAVKSARAIFDDEQNLAWQTYADLEMATIFLHQERWEEGRSHALQAIDALHNLGLTVKEAQGHLLLGRILFHLGEQPAAQRSVERALRIAREKDVPALAYQAHFWRGQICQAEGDPGSALAAYEAAIRQLERLQGQIMVEFRADFLVDKQTVYAEAVRLCLSSQNPAAALQLVERSRSRALLDLVTHRVDMRLEARSPQDQVLVDELLHLREERSRLHRRWETHEIPGNETHQQADQHAEQENREQLRRDILKIEGDIKNLWHRLLLHNRAYTREASLWQVNPTQPLPDIPPATAIIEYFVIEDEILAFVVAAGQVSAYSLPLTTERAGRLQQMLKHALDMVRSTPAVAIPFLSKTQHILQELYDGLLAPVYPLVQEDTHLIIIPYGGLHYLPWHAFFDGEQYLLARHQVSVLPSVHLLNQLDTPFPPDIKPETLLMGHTRQGQLPHVRQELEGIGRSLGLTPRLDEQATRTLFLERAAVCGLIHIASHGEFRRAEPLFSGLQLDDGLLTTLDIFNVQLRASLVCLSACETGRAVLGGGDELFGLMRAFMAGGAASLVMSLWRVDDESTARLMTSFYEHLRQGVGKGEALRLAQMALAAEGGIYAHPYFWAPFFLVGESGPLPLSLRPALQALATG